MKKFRIIAVLAIAFCFLLGTTSVYGYEHNLTVSGGNGSIDGFDGNAGTSQVTITTGENATLTVGEKSYDVIPPGGKDGKYFVTGMKLAGHDNNDDAGPFDTASAVSANEDTDVVVAYGLKSNMVKYTISYVDRGGSDLLASETHYGVIGQSPIVSYKYVDGYLPDAWNAKMQLLLSSAPH